MIFEFTICLVYEFNQTLMQLKMFFPAFRPPILL